MQLAAAMAIEEELLPALETLRAALDAKVEGVLAGRQDRSDPPPGRHPDPPRPGVPGLRRPGRGVDPAGTGGTGGAALGAARRDRRRDGDQRPSRTTPAEGRAGSPALTGLDVRETTNHFHAQATLDAVIAAHGGLRTIALSSGRSPRTSGSWGWARGPGIGEIALPETQPGSSIMPGKVNPVIVESLTMVVARVIGNDATVAFGQTGSFLELNVMMPVTAVALLESIALLAAPLATSPTAVSRGSTATERGPALVEQGLMLATALAPEIGYDEAAALAKEAYKSGRTIRELAAERGIAADRLDELLDPAR